jgi:thioredoxin 1
MIFTVTKDNFINEVQDAAKPVLVELWAPWCSYCRGLSSVLDRLSIKLGDSLPIGKINIDEEPELAEQLQASVIPTLYIFKKGAHGEKLVAPSSQAQLEKWIGDQLK